MPTSRTIVDGSGTPAAGAGGGLWSPQLPARIEASSALTQVSPLKSPASKPPAPTLSPQLSAKTPASVSSTIWSPLVSPGIAGGGGGAASPFVMTTSSNEKARMSLTSLDDV